MREELSPEGVDELHEELTLCKSILRVELVML